MNRTGLLVALAVAVAVGGLCAAYPRLDLDLAALLFDPATRSFLLSGRAWVPYARDAASFLIALLVAPAVCAVVGKVVAPRRPMLIPGRAALFLIVSLVLGPFLLANVILKDHWARMRPTDVVVFAGVGRFTPWWDPRGPCPDNCSFIAGEPSGAFWTLAPAALAPPQWRPLAYAAAIAFGVAVGWLRMAAGAHFFSDVVFAGVLMFLVVWTVHGLIFRWRRTRLTDAAVERPLERAGTGMAAVLAAFVRRVAGRTKQRS